MGRGGFLDMLEQRMRSQQAQEFIKKQQQGATPTEASAPE